MEVASKLRVWAASCRTAMHAQFIGTYLFPANLFTIKPDLRGRPLQPSNMRGQPRHDSTYNKYFVAIPCNRFIIRRGPPRPSMMILCADYRDRVHHTTYNLATHSYFGADHRDQAWRSSARTTATEFTIRLTTLQHIPTSARTTATSHR